MPPQDATVLEALAEREAQISDLESAEKHLSSGSAQVCSSLGHLRSEAAELRNCLAPILSLPEEVVVLIIEHAKPSFKFNRSLSRSRLPFPIPFSRIIRRWRDIVLNTSSLWTMILVPECELWVFDYLERSKNRLLDIRITSQPPTRRGYALLHAITLHVGRWRRLDMQFDFKMTFLRSLEDLAAPCLESVSLVLDGRLHSHPNLPHCFRGGAPLLSRCHLDGIPLRKFFPPRNIITSLHYQICQEATPADYDECRRLIGSMCLTELTLEGTVENLCSEGVELELPLLLSLTIIGFWSAAFVLSAISSINAPALQRLALRDIGRDDLLSTLCHARGSDSSAPSIFPGLQSLLIWRDNNPTAGDSVYLPAVEDLVSITPHDDVSQCAVPFAGSLSSSHESSTESSGIIFPCLHTLTLGPSEPYDREMLIIFQDTLIRFVTWRINIGKPIARLRLHGDNFPSSALSLAHHNLLEILRLYQDNFPSGGILLVEHLRDLVEVEELGGN